MSMSAVSSAARLGAPAARAWANARASGRAWPRVMAAAKAQSARVAGSSEVRTRFLDAVMGGRHYRPVVRTGNRSSRHQPSPAEGAHDRRRTLARGTAAGGQLGAVDV